MLRSYLLITLTAWHLYSPDLHLQNRCVSIALYPNPNHWHSFSHWGQQTGLSSTTKALILGCDIFYVDQRFVTRVHSKSTYQGIWSCFNSPVMNSTYIKEFSYPKTPYQKFEGIVLLIASGTFFFNQIRILSSTMKFAAYEYLDSGTVSQTTTEYCWSMKSWKQPHIRNELTVPKLCLQ